MSDRHYDYSDRRTYYKTYNYRPEHSLYVGDLSSNVNDDMLYNAFVAYKSLRSAKVVLDATGKSKNFGFVRFNEETDQQKALIEMQNVSIGKRAVRVSLAAPKRMEAPGSNTYYNPHYNGGQYNYGWGAYNCGYNTPSRQMDYYGYYGTKYEEDTDKLEDPQLEVDVEKENNDFMISSEAFFTAMDQSRWHPLDHVTSQLRSGIS